MKTPPINTKFINSLPVLLSSSIACIIVYAYHWSTYFSPLFLGIIAGGLVDLDNGLTGKLKNLCFTIVAFTISSLPSCTISLARAMLSAPNTRQSG